MIAFKKISFDITSGEAHKALQALIVIYLYLVHLTKDLFWQNAILTVFLPSGAVREHKHVCHTKAPLAPPRAALYIYHMVTTTFTLVEWHLKYTLVRLFVLPFHILLVLLPDWLY